jgi:hypothetical protein
MARSARLRGLWLVPILSVAVACSGGPVPGAPGSAAGDGNGGGAAPGGPGGGAGAPAAGNVGMGNTVPVVVDSGPPGTTSVDVPFITLSVCVPGTSNCQTIDYVSVDTGSSGLRLVASVLSAGLALPQRNASTGDPLVECAQFGDGYTWGSVRLADVRIAGEVAAGVPVQLIGDPTFASVPSDCSSSGPSENTVATFGANGLLGIDAIVADCGAYCDNPARVQGGAYYACHGSSCAPVAVADADQVSNPIAAFGRDSNGAVLDFPSVPAAGAPTVSGSLLFGIGTQADNGLGSASVVALDGNGEFSTDYKGTTFPLSFIDSGTNSLAFDDRSIAPCTGNLQGLYCPSSRLSLTAQNRGMNGVVTTVSFSVDDPRTLFDHASYAAFDDLAGAGVGGTIFDWGFPFFIGRRVYVALDGASTPGGKGPYVAY